MNELINITIYPGKHCKYIIDMRQKQLVHIFSKSASK